MSQYIISANDVADLNSEFFKKSHRLVFSQLALTPVEHDIMALFLSKLHKDHWEDYLSDGKIDHVPRYEFTPDLLSEWFDVDKRVLYATLDKPADRLSSKKIGIRNKRKNSFDFMPLFKRIKYEGGTLMIVPNDELISEYLCLSHGHSQVPHKQFRAIDLEHSKRLFTMLCRFKDGSGELHPQTIEELHAFFGLLDNNGELIRKTYKSTSVLISRILKPAIEKIDINVPEIQFDVDEKTGNYGFGYIKEGRTIKAIKFLFSWKNQKRIASKDSAALTYEDAVKTYRDLMSGIECLPTEEELEYTLINIGIMVLDKELGFPVDMGGFMLRYNEAKAAIASM